MKRLRVIAGRWVSLLSCGALAAVVWILVGGAVKSSLGSVSEHLGLIPSHFLAPLIFIVIAAIFWPFGRRRWRAFFGIQHFFSYPPLWLAVVVALAFLGAYTWRTSGLQPIFDAVDTALWHITSSPWVAVGIVGTIGVVAGQRLVSSPNPYLRQIIKFIVAPHQWLVSSPNNGSRKEQLCTDWEKLREWIQDDEEVTHRDDDRFGHMEVARRIVGRLTKSGESPTMAVVGELGSGKSTIRALVAHDLDEDSSVQMVSLSLWPFDSSEAAVAGILRAVIQSLGEHVNTLALTGLSEQYVSTIERVGGRWGALARHLHGESQPEAVLDSLATIAKASGIKLVLWIEDLERFTGADRLGTDATAIYERQGAILSLLYLLDRCERISVIISDTSLDSRLDIGKIARFVERPPRLTPKYVWKQIAILRKGCLAEKFIDPASHQRRTQLDPPEDGGHFDMWLWSIQHTEPRIQESVALLLETPRALKSALRLTWDTWDQLRGEIDFDDVLVVSTLRVARPDVFAFIDKHVDQFRSGFHDPFSSDYKKKRPEKKQLEKILETETERMRAAIQRVITFVFPAALREFRNTDSHEYIQCPQGLSVNRHVNYWQRYLTLSDNIEDARDQVALRTIAAWKNGEKNELVARLLDGDKSRQIETFVGQFSAADLLRLLKETVDVLLNQSAKTWADEGYPPAIESIWRMMDRYRPRSDALAKVLNELIQKVTPNHLPLAHILHHYFTASEGDVPRLLDEGTRKQVDAAFFETFRSSFLRGSSERLLAAIRDGTPYIVIEICRVLGWEGSNQTQGQPWKGWEVMADVLLDAAEKDPQRGVPLIVPFVMSRSKRLNERKSDEFGEPEDRHERVDEFDEEAARRLFNFERLMRILADTEPFELDGEDQLSRNWKAAHEPAIAYIERKNDT